MITARLTQLRYEHGVFIHAARKAPTSELKAILLTKAANSRRAIVGTKALYKLGF